MPLYLVNVTYAVEAKSDKAAEAIVEAVCIDTTGVLNTTAIRWTSTESVKVATPEEEEEYD